MKYHFNRKLLQSKIEKNTNICWNSKKEIILKKSRLIEKKLFYEKIFNMEDYTVLLDPWAFNLANKQLI